MITTTCFYCIMISHNWTAANNYMRLFGQDMKQWQTRAVMKVLISSAGSEVTINDAG